MSISFRSDIVLIWAGRIALSSYTKNFSFHRAGSMTSIHRRLPWLSVHWVPTLALLVFLHVSSLLLWLLSSCEIKSSSCIQKFYLNRFSSSFSSVDHCLQVGLLIVFENNHKAIVFLFRFSIVWTLRKQKISFLKTIVFLKTTKGRR